MRSDVSDPTMAVWTFFGVALVVAGVVAFGLVALAVGTVVQNPRRFATPLELLALALANPLAVAMARRESKIRGLDRRARVCHASLVMLTLAVLQLLAFFAGFFAWTT